MRGATIFCAFVSCSAAVAAIDGCVSDELTIPPAADAGGGSDAAVASDTALPMDAAGGGDAADAAPWTPAVLPGLVMWLSAEDLAAGKVSTWMDRSGNANNAAQSVAANQPTVLTGANGINNLPAVRFDGTSSVLTVNDLVTLRLGTGDFRVALAARSSGQDGGFGILMEKHLLEAGAFEGVSFHINDFGIDGYIRGNTSVQDLGNFADNNTHIFGMYRILTAGGSAGGTFGIGVDGTAASNEAMPPSIDVSGTGYPLTIGGRLNPDGGPIPTALLRGDIAELILVKGNTGADTKALVSYLKTKYGVP